jgi:hypothetical protein
MRKSFTQHQKGLQQQELQQQEIQQQEIQQQEIQQQEIQQQEIRQVFRRKQPKQEPVELQQGQSVSFNFLKYLFNKYR